MVKLDGRTQASKVISLVDLHASINFVAILEDLILELPWIFNPSSVHDANSKSSMVKSNSVPTLETSLMVVPEPSLKLYNTCKPLIILELASATLKEATSLVTVPKEFVTTQTKFAALSAKTAAEVV